jgi:hypothetical protein
MGTAEEDKVNLSMAVQLKSEFIVLAFVILSWTLNCSAQTSQQTPVSTPERQGTPSHSDQLPTQQSPGTIHGTIVDQSGALVAGAHVKLTAANPSLNQEVQSGGDGHFTLINIAPGPFQLTISSSGFATQTFSGVLHPGEIDTVPLIVLAVASNVTEVQVGVSPVEIAEEQLKVEEKQRVLGIIPNFYVTYIPDAAPLNSKQKFKLAWKAVVDPFTLVVVGGVAGVQQAQDHFKEYGQGAQGYGKRFAAGYGDTLTGTFIGGAILPSLLKQDPRYFYKGTGTMESRFLYAMANSVICKGDNRRWQPNYSNILGSLAAGGISNLYYPSRDRNGVELTFENAALGVGGTAITNLLQEFVIRKLTPKLPKQDPAKP